MAVPGVEFIFEFDSCLATESDLHFWFCDQLGRVGCPCLFSHPVPGVASQGQVRWDRSAISIYISLCLDHDVTVALRVRDVSRLLRSFDHLFDLTLVCFSFLPDLDRSALSIATPLRGVATSTAFGLA